MRKFLSFSTILFCVGSASAYTLQYNPFLLNTKDSKGITLAKTLDGIYGDIVIQESR